ncbi:MAG: CheA signal transduction histidine kinase, partial [Verrucomicrobiales bacterium]|nr:CheA signal transduction histidine kinase [Verrucomicrobiales bacterium]
MSSKEEEFLKSLRATFKVEAGEHLEAISAGLLALEKSSVSEDQRAIVEAVFRAAHSLKGAARAVNFTEVEAICQSLEEVFSTWKRQRIAPSPQALDKVHHRLDAVTGILARSATQQTATAQPAVTPQAPASPATETSAPVLSGGEPVAPEKSAMGETVRISIAKLDARLLEAEEMLAAKLMAGQRTADLRELRERFGEWQKEWASVQPEVRALRQTFERSASAERIAASSGLNRLMEFFDWNYDYLRSFESRIAALCETASHDHLAVGKLVDDLLADSKKMLMLPLATLGALFPKLVRDLCRDQGKECDLVVRGEEVEIDKRILEEMKDPLIHLLRNCVDHGVEAPDLRIKLGKPARATITLAVSRVNGNKVELLVSDDGSGIEVEKVKASAVKHGLISAEEADRLSESEARALIFKADVSTSPIITRLSGRGLGLAIVQEKTEKLGGRVSVESSPHSGTAIRI